MTPKKAKLVMERIAADFIEANKAFEALKEERDSLANEYDCLLHERDRLLKMIELAGQDISTLTAERDELLASRERAYEDARVLRKKLLAMEADRNLIAPKAKPGISEPYKTTADGIETRHNLPVLVPAGLIPDGRTPCEVRSYRLPYDRDWIGDRGDVYGSCLSEDLKIGELHILLADKPLFEIGKCYRNRRGEVRGPLEMNSEARKAETGCVYVWWDGEYSYTKDGWLYEDGECLSALLPVAVDPPPPTWAAPASLPDGEWKWNGDRLYAGSLSITVQNLVFRDWTDPPRDGVWLVKDGIGTWQGEAK